MSRYGIRPVDITPKMISKWTEEVQEIISPYDEIDQRELFFAGEYLHMKVLGMGATEQQARDMCFNLGRLAWPRCEKLWDLVNQMVLNQSSNEGERQ